MDEKNKKILWLEILKTGDFLKNKLPYSSLHPKGRNSYAHVALMIKNKFKDSYKNLPDENFNDVIKYINFIKNNPN